MGEAKRKKGIAADEERLWQAIEAKSMCPSSMPGKDCVHALVVGLEQSDEARRALGALPSLCAEYLAEAARLKSTGEADETPEAVWWERWPSGRQTVQMLRLLDDVRTLYPSQVYRAAGVRGYGVQLAAFPEDGWPEAIKQAHDESASEIEKLRDLMNKAPRVLRTSPLPHISVVTIPKIDSDGSRGGMVAQTLRIFDELAATKESLIHNFGRLLLTFEGYDDDPRPVWDIEQNAQFLRIVAWHAPWWPWLIASEQAVMWIGAQISDGPTTVTRMQNVAFPIKEKDAEALLELALRGSLEALESTGTDLSSVDTQQRLAKAMLSLKQTINSVTQLDKDLKTGVAELASDSELEEGRMQFALVLDRSERARPILEALESDGLLLLPEAIGIELRKWSSETNYPLALLTGTSEEQESWSFHASGDSDDELRDLVECVAAAAVGANVPVVWMMGIDNALVEKLSTGAAEVAERRGLTSHMEQLEHDTLSHRGLLNLAVDPGGQEVDFDSVQILDADVFDKVLHLGVGTIIETLSQMRKGGNMDIDPDEMVNVGNVRAWRRDDNSLLIRQTEPPMREVIAPPGSWRLLDAAQLQQGMLEVQQRMSQAPEFIEDLANVLSESMESSARRNEALNKAKEKATSLVILFGRETASLSALRSLIRSNEDAMDAADRWLQSDQRYFLFWTAKDGRAAATTSADDAELLSESLGRAMQLGDSPQSTFLICYADASVDAEARAWWKKHDGLVMNPGLSGH